MCTDIVASNCSAGYIFPNICTEACMLSSFFDNFDYRLSYSRSEKQIFICFFSRLIVTLGTCPEVTNARKIKFYLLFLSLNRNFDYRLSY